LFTFETGKISRLFFFQEVSQFRAGK